MAKKTCYFLQQVLSQTGMVEKGSYTVPEVVLMLGVSRATVFRMLKKGTLGTIDSPGGKPRVSKDSLMIYFSPWDEGNDETSNKKTSD
jgi:excisionase family DNA binding protein